MSSFLLVTVPVGGKDSQTAAFAEIKDPITSYGQNGQIFKFEMPDLVVGTLDNLVALSDDLVKINTQVENVVRKVERSYVEVAGTSEALKVNSKTVNNYLSKFEWDVARYQIQGRPLNEIVAQIQGLTAKVDDELKKLSLNHSEKTLANNAALRRKVINLAQSDFEDILATNEVARIDITNNDYLNTLMVVVPKAIEQEFLNTYHSIGEDIAYMGNPDYTSMVPGTNDGNYGPNFKRDAKKGSPIAPGSAVKIKEEGDSILYSVVALKGHYIAGTIDAEGKVDVPPKAVDYFEPLKTAFRDKRLTLRQFAYEPSKAGSVDALIATTGAQLKQAHDTLVNWIQVNFSEVYGGWAHLKVIRAFVESVLRYGVPVRILSFFVEPDMKREKQLKVALSKSIEKLQPSLFSSIKNIDNDDEDEDDTENLPYVCQKIPMIGGK